MTFPKTFQKNLRVKPQKKKFGNFWKKKICGQNQKKILKKKFLYKKIKNLKNLKKLEKIRNDQQHMCVT